MKSMLKVTIATASAALLIIGLVGCNRTPAADNGAAAPMKVTLSLSTLNNPFFVEVRDGAKAEAKKLGVQLDILDAQNDRQHRLISWRPPRPTVRRLSSSTPSTPTQPVPASPH